MRAPAAGDALVQPLRGFFAAYRLRRISSRRACLAGVEGIAGTAVTARRLSS